MAEEEESERKEPASERDPGWRQLLPIDIA